MGLFGGGTTTQKSSTKPWKAQVPYLKEGFSQAQDLYKSKVGTPFYQGDLYANMDPLTSQGIGLNADYATGQGADLANNFTTTGTNLFGAGQAGLNLYQQLAGMANQDPTQANIASATAYANNPAIDGMIDAASRDVSRNLYENQLTGLNAAASGSGNMNSSRAGVAEGIAKRGAQDSIYDISSNIRGNAFDQGLQLAQNARNSNMSALSSAGAGYGSMFGQGLDAAAAGNNMAYQNNNALISGGQLNQQDQQGQIDADFTRWNGGDNRDFDLLNKYWNIIGSNNWGSQSKATTTTPSNILGSIAVLATSAVGAYKAFK